MSAGDSGTFGSQKQMDAIYRAGQASIKRAKAMKARTMSLAKTHPFNPLAPNSQFEMPKGAKYPSYKKGGKVKKTGLALLHKGEEVVPKKKVAAINMLKKAMKRLKK